MGAEGCLGNERNAFSDRRIRCSREHRHQSRCVNPRFSHSIRAQELISQSSKTNAYVHENVLRLLIKEESIATQKRRERTALTHLACVGEVGDGDQEREATTRRQERHVYIAKLAFAKVRGSVAFRRQLVHALCNGPRPSYSDDIGCGMIFSGIGGEVVVGLLCATNFFTTGSSIMF